VRCPCGVVLWFRGGSIRLFLDSEFVGGFVLGGRRRRQIGSGVPLPEKWPDNRRRRAVFPSGDEQSKADCRRLLLPLFPARVFRDEFWNIGRDATDCQ